jgi:hypothetical protein
MLKVNNSDNSAGGAVYYSAHLFAFTINAIPAAPASISNGHINNLGTVQITGLRIKPITAPATRTRIRRPIKRQRYFILVWFEVEVISLSTPPL